MAAAVEFYADNANDVGDYLVGEEVALPGLGQPALRFMDRPSRDGNSADSWSSSTKNLDVHYSSGVANHFYYLLSEGSGAKTINGVSYNSPTSNGSTITGIGRDAATKIWYRALTTYMTSSTNYQGAHRDPERGDGPLRRGQHAVQHGGRRLVRGERQLGLPFRETAPRPRSDVPRGRGLYRVDDPPDAAMVNNHGHGYDTYRKRTLGRLAHRGPGHRLAGLLEARHLRRDLVRGPRSRGKTSPEELIAAAHSTCYSMALSHALAGAGSPPEKVDTKAEVTFQPGEGITGVHLTVRASVPGLSAADFGSSPRTPRPTARSARPRGHHHHPGRGPRLRVSLRRRVPPCWGSRRRTGGPWTRRARRRATGGGGRSRARACRGRPSPRTPTARAGSWTCAAPRRAQEQVDVRDAGLVQVAGEDLLADLVGVELAVPDVAGDRRGRVRDLGPAAVVHAELQGEDVVAAGHLLGRLQLLDHAAPQPRRPAQRTRTPIEWSWSRRRRITSRLKPMRKRTSSGDRFQFSVENAYADR